MRTAADLPALPPPATAGLPSELLTRRPDLLAAERRLAAAGARVEAARAALFPRISLTSSAGTTSDSLSDLLDSDFFVWNLAGNLLQPLFEGGRLRGQIELSEAQREELAELYVQRALNAYAEVESALVAEDILRQREVALTSALAEANAAQQLSDQRYRDGLAEFVTVLDAQRRALSAESELLSVRRQRLDVRVDLHLALGGGFPNTSRPSRPQAIGLFALRAKRPTPFGPRCVSLGSYVFEQPGRSTESSRDEDNPPRRDPGTRL